MRSRVGKSRPCVSEYRLCGEGSLPCMGGLEECMDYQCVLSLSRIREYLSGAVVVGFDFETAPMEEYRLEERAALDAHKSVIAGVSFSVSEGSGIYVPLRHRAGENAAAPGEIWQYLRQAFFEMIVTPMLEATSSLITTTLSISMITLKSWMLKFCEIK